MSSKSPPAPADAASRRAAKPTVVYPAGTLPRPDMAMLEAARQSMVKIGEIVVPPRDGRAFRVSHGQFFRIVSIEGPQSATSICGTRTIFRSAFSAARRERSTPPMSAPVTDYGSTMPNL